MISCSNNFHNHHSKKHYSSSNIMISTSLHTFESEISKSLSQLSSSEINLPWIQKCLQILPAINKAFNNLVMDLDYPITKWEMISTDEYLASSLNSLEYLNSINSSLTQLSQANMVLTHGTTLVKQQETLKPIQNLSWNSSTEKNSYYRNEVKEEKELKFSSEKEWIIHQALLIKRTIWYWVCKVIDSSIHGDVQTEMNKTELSAFSSSPLISLQLSKICEQIKENEGSVLKEVDDVNGSVVRLSKADFKSEPLSGAVNELKGKLEVLGTRVENFKDDVNKLFSEVLTGRNEFLDSFQQRKQFSSK